SNAGIVVDVTPGEILVNKFDPQQNLVTTREAHMYVPKGGSRSIYGLWTACIDASKEAPDLGGGFDLAPPLTQWTGVPAAAAMQKLLDYVNQHGLFCSFNAQNAVWDLS